MNLDEIIDQIIFWGRDHPIIALFIALAFFFLLFRKPKFILSILSLIVILALIYSLIMDTASSGKTSKKRLIHEAEKNSTPR